ncbi:transposase [Leptospira santarosai str. JET]|nr:transposase [Leptospira santarosai str. JET]
MKSQDSNYVGIDCGKKSLEVIRINSEGSYERQQFSTTEIGISKLINWLNPNDVVGLVFLACKEPLAKLRCSLAISLFMNRSIGSQSFRIAKSILNKGIQVIVLNPGDLATIYQSLKKNG